MREALTIVAATPAPPARGGIRIVTDGNTSVCRFSSLFRQCPRPWQAAAKVGSRQDTTVMIARFFHGWGSMRGLGYPDGCAALRAGARREGAGVTTFFALGEKRLERGAGAGARGGTAYQTRHQAEAASSQEALSRVRPSNGQPQADPAD